MVMAFRLKEIFCSIQGEGPAIGQPATFVRFSGCNLACTFCDTPHEPGSDISLEEIIAAVQQGPSRVVITGGEPLLAGNRLVALAQAIVDKGRVVDIETNGTLAPPAGLRQLVAHYVISPKLANSGNSPALRELAPGLPPGPFKFVVDRLDDLEEVRETAARHPEREIIVMPMGTEPEVMLRKMKELRKPVESCGWRLLPRLQVLLGIR